MSQAEHEPIWSLLAQHLTITRKVDDIPEGVKTTTTTSRPELVETLRKHVRQMALRVEQGRPVRLWDPIFRNVFAHADEIEMKVTDVDGGVEVVETSTNPRVVPFIQAHARAVNRFVKEGHAAARPPWAGGGRR